MTEEITEERAVPQPPRPLLLSRWFWIASTLVGAVHSLVQVADRRALLARIQDIAPELSQSELDTAANGEVLFALLSSALTFACYLLVSNRMVQGRKWARVVLAILGGLNALGVVLTVALVGALGTSLVHQLTGVLIRPTDLVFACAGAVVGVVALVLMFQRDANRYFREVPRHVRRVDTA